MNQPEDNPYAAPPSVPSPGQAIPELPAADQKKVEAIIKDAGQFWLAIILCILCNGIGSLIVPIWYGVRLSQWSRLGRQYPFLLTPGAAPGSLAQKFVSSRWKLMVGLLFGLMMIGLLFLYVLFLVLVPLPPTFALG